MSEGRVERRVSAILAADVVGYSRLMETDEEGTLAALRQHRREFFDPLREHPRNRKLLAGQPRPAEYSGSHYDPWP